MDETVSLTSQVLTMTDAQWVAMEPSRLDGMVAELMASPKADFWGARIWMRLNHPSMRKAEPLTQAAFSVARARICVLTSQETARVWLGQAQECAENVSLDDVFDIAGLRQQIDEPPQVVDGR
ncbi:MAG: hypothetical protein FWD80_02985, partial [Propionibacteriaceae bacterium]|nr:hypothetical protein [Propionibacteriaceae bacterium]